MVPLDSTTAIFCRLSVVTMFPSAAVWPHFLLNSFKLQVAVSRK